MFTAFENLFSIIIYCVPMLSLHIKSINSMISDEVATVHLCSFAECKYRLGNTMLAMCTISRYYQQYVELPVNPMSIQFG